MTLLYHPALRTGDTLTPELAPLVDILGAYEPELPCPECSQPGYDLAWCKTCGDEGTVLGLRVPCCFRCREYVDLVEQDWTIMGERRVAHESCAQKALGSALVPAGEDGPKIAEAWEALDVGDLAGFVDAVHDAAWGRPGEEN